MKGTAINWCDNTFNCWEGCTKVSPGCTHCYAKVQDDRHLRAEQSHWGPGKLTADHGGCLLATATRMGPRGRKGRHQARVFCASMADWADDEAPAGQRDRLWDLIRQTPHLDWLLLTKRANNIKKCFLPMGSRVRERLVGRQRRESQTRITAAGYPSFNPGNGSVCINRAIA